jgi:hypothetical protein
VVDVWEELGKAVGRALKPISDIGASVWRSLGGAMQGLVGDLMGSAGSIKTTQQPTITGLIPDVLAEATAALSEESPPKEVKEAVDKMILQLTKKIEKESKTKAGSVPTMVDLAKSQAALVAAVTTMYAATHAISIALDASHPFKDWGFKSAVMDMLFQFKLGDVVGPMIQAPIWSGVIVPLRMRWNEMYPYDIPASGTLPYLRLKTLITEDEYNLNMKFHALDETWAKALKDNAVRYPDWADVRTMIHRGKKTWADAKDVLEKSLIKSDYIAAYEELLPSIPGPGDLVDMAVREAYQERSGDGEMPERFVTEMAKWGYDRDACLWFWRKHWRLPGVDQVYDMGHRTIATPQTIEQFLKWADYAPEWRAPLEKLSWRLPGRIDARWLARWGEIDEAGLADLLQKAGLASEWAPRVAKAVYKNQYIADINRQVSNIKADFVKGTVLEAGLRSDLAALGIAQTFVDYHVTDALEDRTRAQKDDRLSLLKARYTRGAVTMATVIVEAEQIILDKDTRDLWLQALPELKQEKAVEETYAEDINRLVANVKADYVQGTILKDALVKRLQFLGLPDQVIQYQLMDADEDRARKRATERLDVIKDMWLKDVEADFDVITGWVKEIVVDEEARENWLSDVYFQKMKAVKL